LLDHAVIISYTFFLFSGIFIQRRVFIYRDRGSRQNGSREKHSGFPFDLIIWPYLAFDDRRSRSSGSTFYTNGGHQNRTYFGR